MCPSDTHDSMFTQCSYSLELLLQVICVDSFGQQITNGGCEEQVIIQEALTILPASNML